MISMDGECQYTHNNLKENKTELISKNKEDQIVNTMFRRHGTRASRNIRVRVFCLRGSHLLRLLYVRAASLLFLLLAPTTAPAGAPVTRGRRGREDNRGASETEEASVKQTWTDLVHFAGQSNGSFSTFVCSPSFPTTSQHVLADVYQMFRYVLIIGYIWTENATRNGTSSNYVDDYLVALTSSSSAITVHLVIRVRGNECLH